VRLPCSDTRERASNDREGTAANRRERRVVGRGMAESSDTEVALAHAAVSSQYVQIAVWLYEARADLARLRAQLAARRPQRKSRGGGGGGDGAETRQPPPSPRGAAEEEVARWRRRCLAAWIATALLLVWLWVVDDATPCRRYVRTYAR
jgi:hypothetical protein